MTATVHLEDHDGVDVEHWLLQCDVCKTVNFDCPTLDESERLAAEDGWSVMSKGHICGPCEDFMALSAQAHFAGSLGPDSQARLEEHIRRVGGPGRYIPADPGCSCPGCRAAH